MISALVFLLGSTPTFDLRWQLAFQRGPSEGEPDVWVSRADGKGAKLIARKARNPRWSPDGKLLAYYRRGKVFVFDFQRQRETVVGQVAYPIEETKYHNGDCYIDWDPKTKIILSASIQGEGIQLLGGGGSILGPRNSQWHTYGPRWSPSGRDLAFIRNGDIWLAHRDLSQVSIDPVNYYEAANRLAPLAVFNDMESGASATTPFWVDDLEWTRDETRLVFHFQRQGGSGVSEIGYLDLRRAKNDAWATASGFRYQTHWILHDVWSPRICPDGKTLSYVSLGSDQNLFVCSWDGKTRRQVLKDVLNPDWRPIR